jgi:hypothetical protein
MATSIAMSQTRGGKEDSPRDRWRLTAKYGYHPKTPMEKNFTYDRQPPAVENRLVPLDQL